MKEESELKIDLGDLPDELKELILKTVKEKDESKDEDTKPWEKFKISQEDWELIERTKEVYGSFEGSTGKEYLDKVMKDPEAILAELEKEVEEIRAKAKKLEADEKRAKELEAKAETTRKDFEEFMSEIITTKKPEIMKEEKTTAPETKSEAPVKTATDPSAIKTVKIKIEQDSDIVKGTSILDIDTEKFLQQLWKRNPDEVIRMIGLEAILEKIGADAAFKHFS